MRQIILGQDEEIYFSLGNYSFNYVVKSNPEYFDKISLGAALADHVLSAQLENLEEQHFEILHFCLHNEQDSLNMDM